MTLLRRLGSVLLVSGGLLVACGAAASADGGLYTCAPGWTDAGSSGGYGRCDRAGMTDAEVQHDADVFAGGSSRDDLAVTLADRWANSTTALTLAGTAGPAYSGAGGPGAQHPFMCTVTDASGATTWPTVAGCRAEFVRRVAVDGYAAPNSHTASAQLTDLGQDFGNGGAGTYPSAPVQQTVDLYASSPGPYADAGPPAPAPTPTASPSGSPSASPSAAGSPSPSSSSSPAAVSSSAPATGPTASAVASAAASAAPSVAPTTGSTGGGGAAGGGTGSAPAPSSPAGSPGASPAVTGSASPGAVATPVASGSPVALVGAAKVTDGATKELSKVATIALLGVAALAGMAWAIKAAWLEWRCLTTALWMIGG